MSFLYPGILFGEAESDLFWPKLPMRLQLLPLISADTNLALQGEQLWKY